MIQQKQDMMTIGEVAKLIGITRRIILNYEAKGLIQPTKKEGSTGNRYYTADSIARIRTIRILQNMGLSLDEIFSYYNGQTDLAPLIVRLEKLRDELSLNIEKLKERVKSDNDYVIRTITLPEQTIYRKTLRTDSVEEKTSILREVFMTAVRSYGTDSSKRMMFMEHCLDDPNLVSYCISVPPQSQGEGIEHVPEEKALCIFYHGGYEFLPGVKEILLTYAEENSIQIKGICRNTFLEGPPQHKDPSKFITQVALLIK